MKSAESQSSLLCHACYTHLDDFHKFALLIKEKQETLSYDIPTIKLEDSDDEQDDEEDVGYIRDTDVLVEFKTDGENNYRDRNQAGVHFCQDELLVATKGYQNHNNYYNENHAGFGQLPWLTADDVSYK